MLKKIVLGTLLVGLIGILVAGAVIRTVEKTGNVAEAREAGQGRGNGGESNAVDSAGAGRGGNSRGGGNGQAAGTTAERQYLNYEDVPENWETYQGTVVQAPEAGTDLVIAVDDGRELVVGTGPGYMEAEGFALQAGEQVQVYGYWDGDELKAAQITRLRDGETISLRDQAGRPAWAGSGQRSTEQAAAGSQGGRGQGGAVTPGGAAGTGDAVGLAEVSEWLTAQGMVVSADSGALVVALAGGDELTIDGRTWSYAQEQGFRADPGDVVTLVGFDEDGDFEVGQIGNDTTGQLVQIREETGRPLWAGGGRRGG
jgi:hypothetical protein